MPVQPTPRPGIMEISPYVGGRSTASGHANTIKLSSNESALGPSPKAQAAYRELAGSLHRYPDGGATELRMALGALHGIDPDRIVCGNGSDELLQLVAHAYAGPGDEIVYCRHGFLVYPIATLAVGATPVVAPETDYTADVDAILGLVTERTRIVFLANPNNPTGTYIPKGELRRLWGGLPEHVVLVVDSAYAEFAPTEDYDSGLDLAGMAPNVVMTRTFSKAYGLAALRLGWAYGPPAIIDVLHRIRGPFNANAAALAAALAALEDQDHIARARQHNERCLGALAARLRASGLHVVPSVCNFLLVRFPDEPGRDAAAADRFLTERGIVARRMEPYHLADCLRITIGLEAENEALAQALEAFMAPPASGANAGDDR